MKRKATFTKAYDALTKSFMDGTLLHDSCYACAVGNILHFRNMSALKKKYGMKQLLPILQERPIKELRHDQLAMLNKMDGNWYRELQEYRNGRPSSSERRFNGYSMEEIDMIERAFESYDAKEDQDGIIGLHAVIVVLCKIHGARLKVKKISKTAKRKEIG